MVIRANDSRRGCNLGSIVRFQFVSRERMAAVEVSSERVKGKVKWFNAIKGSGYVVPDYGNELIFFHQSSLKSDGHILNVGDSVEFEVRVDNYGSSKAFDITAPGGGALAGCFCPYGSDHGGDNGCYGGELAGGFHTDGGSRGNDGCYNGGEMANVIWDEDGLHDLDIHGCYGCGQEDAAFSISSEDTVLPVFDEMPLKDGTTGQAGLISFLVPLPLESAALEVFDSMPHKDVVWDEDFGHGLDSHGGLLKQFVHAGEDRRPTVELFTSSVVWDKEPEESHDEMTCKNVVWDEQILSHCDTHGEWFQQLAIGAEYSGVEKSKPTVDILNTLTHVSGGSVLFELGEENPREVLWDDELHHSQNLLNSLLKQLAGWGDYFLDEEMKQIAQPNIEDKLEEDMPENMVEEVLCIVNPLHRRLNIKDTSLGNGAFSLDNNCMQLEVKSRRRLRKALTVTVMGQESTQCRGTVIKDGISFSMSVAVPVFREMSPWRRCALSCWKYKTEADCSMLCNVPSWVCDGFSPWSKINDKALRLVFPAGTYLVGIWYKSLYISVRQWDPDIIRLILSDAVFVEGRCSETAISWRTCRSAHEELLRILCSPRTEMHMLVRLIKKIQFHGLFYEFSGFVCYSSWFCILKRWSNQRVRWFGLDNFSAHKSSLMPTHTSYGRLLHLSDAMEFVMGFLIIRWPWDPGIHSSNHETSDD